MGCENSVSGTGIQNLDRRPDRRRKGPRSVSTERLASRELPGALSFRVIFLQKSRSPSYGEGEMLRCAHAAREGGSLLFCKGDSEKQVAFKLGTSVNTVHTQARHIREKYGVHSRSRLLALFVPGEILEACKVG
jgi:DNA-binding CsgD family transcriptional regulator